MKTVVKRGGVTSSFQWRSATGIRYLKDGTSETRRYAVQYVFSLVNSVKTQGKLSKDTRAGKETLVARQV